MIDIKSKTNRIYPPALYNKSVDFIAAIFSKAYDFIELFFDQSIVITNFSSHIFSAYRNSISAKLEVPGNEPAPLDYLVFTVKVILQAVIDAALLPIFMALYLPYKAVEILTYHAKKTAQERPITTAAFFATTATVCAIFASPVQLFVLGHIVMTGSPVMNIMFGTMSALVSTLFATNTYVATNKYAKPFLASVFESSCKTFNEPNTSMSSCVASTKAPGAK